MWTSCSYNVELTGLIVEMKVGNMKMPNPSELGELHDKINGLRYWVISEGEGKIPQQGDAVTCHYSGWLEDGTLFDSSRNRDSAFSFQLGEGVIEGWSMMVGNMKVGQKVLVHIQPEYAYGSQGVGPIPPDSALYFEIELLDSF